MIDINIVSTIVGVCAGIGIMVAGCGYTYSSWKSGRNKYKDDIISDLKTSLAIEQDKVHKLNEEKTTLITSHQTQLTELQKEFSELKGRFDEQAKKLEEYKAILQNRDPDTMKLLREISNGITNLNAQQLLDAEKAKTVAKTLAKNLTKRGGE